MTHFGTRAVLSQSLTTRTRPQKSRARWALRKTFHSVTHQNFYFFFPWRIIAVLRYVGLSIAVAWFTGATLQALLFPPPPFPDDVLRLAREANCYFWRSNSLNRQTDWQTVRKNRHTEERGASKIKCWTSTSYTGRQADRQTLSLTDVTRIVENCNVTH